MADMDKKEMEAAVESILFASGEPVNIERICVALAIDRPTAERILQGLMDYYAYERRGMRLLKIEDCWQLCSAPDYAEAIRRAFEIRKPAKLSQPVYFVFSFGFFCIFSGQAALNGRCSRCRNRFHAPTGPPSGSTISASTPALRAASISVSSLSPSMAVWAGDTPTRSIAAHRPLGLGFPAWP